MDSTYRYAETLIHYILYTYTIKAEELQEVLDDLPKNISDMFVSTYDMAVEKGVIKGEKIGMEKGMKIGREEGRKEGAKKAILFHSFETIFKLYSKNDGFTAEFLSEITVPPIPTIQLIMKALKKKDKKKAKELLTKELQKIDPLSKKDKKQMNDLLKKYF